MQERKDREAKHVVLETPLWLLFSGGAIPRLMRSTVAIFAVERDDNVEGAAVCTRSRGCS
jgi:hypothetical protein